MLVQALLVLLSVHLTERSRFGPLAPWVALVAATLPWWATTVGYELTLSLAVDYTKNAGGHVIRTLLEQAMPGTAARALQGALLSGVALAHLALSCSMPTDSAPSSTWRWSYRVAAALWLAANYIAWSREIPTELRMAVSLVPSLAALAAATILRFRLRSSEVGATTVIARGAWLLAWLAGVYAAVMAHRMLVLSQAPVGTTQVDAAIWTRAAILGVGLLGAVSLAAWVARTAKAVHGAVGAASSAALTLSLLLSAGHFVSLLGHHDLFEGWIAYRPPWYGRALEPLALPTDVHREVWMLPKWSQGVTHPYPDNSDDPWALLLRHDGLSLPGSREFVPFDDKPLEAAAKDFASDDLIAVVDRRASAQQAFTVMSELHRAGGRPSILIVYGPIEGTLSFAELQHKRLLLPWIAPLAVEYGRFRLEFAWTLPPPEISGETYLIEEETAPGIIRYKHPQIPIGEQPRLDVSAGDLQKLRRVTPDEPKQVFLRPQPSLDLIGHWRRTQPIRDAGFFPIILLRTPEPSK